MRALLIFTNPFPLSVATLAQIGRDLTAQGWTVDALNGFANLAENGPMYSSRDRLYERVSQKYSRFIRPAINGQDLSKEMNRYQVDIPRLPASMADLRKARFLGSMVGLAALSSAASYTKIASRDDTADYGKPLLDSWVVAHKAAAAADRLRHRYERVYLFNGRHAETRPFCDILEHDSEVIRYEAGAAENSYIHANGPFFDPYVFGRNIIEHEADFEAGRSYFDGNRARTKNSTAFTFIGDQTIGLLPENLSRDGLVTMFTSSEDEIFAVRDDPSFGEFPSQFDVALEVARQCHSLRRPMALRLHPHLAIKSDHWRRGWDFDQLQKFDVHIIEPTQPVDSYSLLDASEAVITCGSTIGIEAAYSGKPSLMIGQYQATVLGACPSAMSAKDIADFLADPKPLPDYEQKALWWASYFTVSGTKIPGLRDSTDPGRANLSGRSLDPARQILRYLRAAKFW
ncbi:hypothetical protein [Novosphingopyxis sp. YJ-S2-01]|uniref:hypothetical protein n=1 Tax=Novosphingopyxis sp. YJ-S2-01 TaxID=2794021 RepID=UPI0018DD18C3|nr:hypothetical protein [Novosphingopyxis sp. YJ-S2-01]MBH9536914.1 hypothetical protein [Novosphingopyxis sp. YJ-S2-01]